MKISVVIPSARAPDVFPECLASVFHDDDGPLEVIIVDDAMDDHAYRIVTESAEKHPVWILDSRGRGVSAARNAGACSAAGDVILFMDTDVVLRPGAFRIIRNALRDPGIDGIVGIQAANLRFTGFFSRWKNHWMRFTYHRLSGNIHLFYTSCAVIRKDVFIASGGFDETYRLPSIEDTVFGSRLGRLKRVIRPEPCFEVEHVKAYGFRSVLATDRKRSSALVRYAMRNVLAGHDSGAGDTSVPTGFMLSAGMMILFLLSGLATILGEGVIGSMLMAGSISAVWLLNIDWLAYLRRVQGPGFMAGAMLFLPVDLLWVIAGIVQGSIGFALGRKY
ncbi:glycosyltransferase family 2 protein [bacterium]|nr:glycosyltransferase family 2 protein [candidate division CSSED10-310 bacterium]